MELGKRIKEQRARQGLSQDDLAARIYVSRQTISSWENDKTYPDVQSLLLLSGVFGASIDELVKGDVETMTKTIDADVRSLNRLNVAMTVSLLLALACIAWFAAQVIAWDWGWAQTVPTALLALLLWGIAVAAGFVAERIKKAHDLATYQEILDYLRGREVDRDTPHGRRVRAASCRSNTARVALFWGLGAVAVTVLVNLVLRAL